VSTKSWMSFLSKENGVRKSDLVGMFYMLSDLLAECKWEEERKAIRRVLDIVYWKYRFSAPVVSWPNDARMHERAREIGWSEWEQ